jgi:tetratricopeptide (TPR) repeat protein/TolB-like protein
MASLIPGYEYDIFISYRQKDNKYDGWVTEFVDNLRKELEGTFKEEISVYFDANPHDGLLETHDVDASLKEKLKCLVFIPIISRTYCDPKSFAWEHEFRAFIEEASKDQFGLKIKLPNGNVANRVLPVRIHDLDSSDARLCESALGGVLRGIEFIYKEPGVNKPLTSDDDNKKNLNGTKYRIQINKVANAINEIFSGLKTEPAEPGKGKIQPGGQSEGIKKKESKEVQRRYNKLTKSRLLAASIVLAVLLVIAGILSYPKIFRGNSKEKITVAVMPFQNNTNDSNMYVWQTGIQDYLIDFLSASEDLIVKQSVLIPGYLQSKGLTSYDSFTPDVASTILKKLDASVMISGGITREGSILRLTAKLTDSKNEEVMKSFLIDGSSDEIMHTSDSLSVMIRNFLIISKFGKGENSAVLPSWTPNTSSSEAYLYHTYGSKAYASGKLQIAKKWFLKSLEIDSNFFIPAYQLSATYFGLYQYDSSKIWIKKLYNKRDKLKTIDQIRTNFMYSKCYGTETEAIEYLTQLTELEKDDVIDLYLLGLNYCYVFQYNKAIPILKRVLEIYDEWDSKPYSVNSYTLLGKVYHETGMYKKEKRLYKKAERDFADNQSIIYRQAILALSDGEIKAANEYIERYKSILKNQSVSEATIPGVLGNIYYEAGDLDKAEVNYRKAISSDQQNRNRMNNFAFFLIDNDRNVNEGLDLVKKLLEKFPNSPLYLHTKGWGLYKQGKYKEALDILQKSWDIRRDKMVYDHEAFLHLEAAKKAVEGQK